MGSCKLKYLVTVELLLAAMNRGFLSVNAQRYWPCRVGFCFIIIRWQQPGNSIGYGVIGAYPFFVWCKLGSHIDITYGNSLS